MKRLGWWLAVALLLAASAASAAILLRGSGGAPTAPTIVDILPHSASLQTTAASGSTVTTFSCVMSDNSTCPPSGSGYVWTMANQPSFLSLNQTTGALTTTATNMPPCTPTQDNCTFPVTIGPPPVASASNCPTTPPAEAQRAGYNTLLFCVNGADPTYANANNFANCNNTPRPGQIFYYQYAPNVGTYPTDCNTVWSQVVDSDNGSPVTVMLFTFVPANWTSTASPPWTSDTLGYPAPGWGIPVPQLPVTAANPNGLIDFPTAGVEYDVRFRQDNLIPYGAPSDLTPDFFSGGTPVAITDNGYTACSGGPPGSNCDNNYDTTGHYGGWEVDTNESYNGGFFNGAIHTWNTYGVVRDPPFIMSGNLYNVPFWTGWTVYHNVSILMTTDGNILQACGYLDHDLVTTPWHGTYQVQGNCIQIDLSGGYQFLLKTRDVLEWWLGNQASNTPNTTHYWIEYEAIWGTSNANAYRINAPVIRSPGPTPPLQADGKAGAFVGWDTDIPSCRSTFTSPQHPTAGCQLTQ